MHYKISQQQLHNIFHVCIYLLLALCSKVAIADIDEIQIINSDKELFSKAVALSLEKKWSQAEPIYRDLLKRNNQWPEPGNNLAILLLNTNRIDEAKNVIEQAVSSSPSYRITQQNRSQLYNYLATQAYDKALGSDQSVGVPELELIKTIYQPVKIIEKEVEKIIIKEVAEEKQPLPDAKLILEPASHESINNHIKQQLLGWSRAWSKGDFEFYIKSYSDEFIPSDARKTYADWKNIRRARLKFTKDVNVEIEQLKVFVDGNGEFVLVEFVQSFQSETYSDKVLKQMYMHNQQDNWLILSERTIKKY